MNDVASRGFEPRHVVSLALGTGALLFRYIRWWEALALLIAALLFTAFGIPRLSARGTARVTDGLQALLAPPALAVLSVLLVVLILPDRLDIAAATAGLLTADAIAGMLAVDGRSARAASRVVLGGAAASLLCVWCRPAIVPPPYGWFSAAAPWVAAGLAAGAASARIRLSSSVRLTAIGAATLWAGSLVSEDRAVEAWAHAGSQWLPALGINVTAAAIGFAAGTVTASGATCGALLGMVIALSVGWQGWLLLLAAFGLTFVATRLGFGRKQLLGIAEPHRGRRAAASAVANTGVATAAALLAAVSYAREPALIAFVAALSAGAADSVASEIGKAWGARTWLPLLMGRTTPGTPGAISLEGTAAGLLTALLLSSLAAALEIVGWPQVIAIAAAAVLASLVESLLAASLEPRGILDSHALNVVATAVAAAAAVLLTRSS